MNNFDDDQSKSDIAYQPLNVESIHQNIKNYDSQKLAEMIVCDRYFGCYRDLAIICMQELARRRASGDNFAFEEYIEQSFKQLPELKLTGLNLRDLVSQTAKSARQ
jgi:hypothetical protein